ncbi:O-antigen ligase domain-containing protein [Stutzerimonas kirkiae]|uniref:O-antigen ligase domain-containing protein n=1 Tax=Stutzerimonas kirkiae TaxID=2211392 RepID=A0A4Q9QZZ0_9GAMM|nr:O-antigen ligase domain-containing protein [Stutzerimonas kirkiae]TBV00659.1 O-antigen ligase domain-containing protein [Stutzerimonas kirkiae]
MEVGLEGSLRAGRLETVLLAWISIGLFVQLAGLLFNNDGSRYATQVYLLLFLPALLLLLKERLALSFWRQWPAYCFLALSVWVLLVAGLHEGSDRSFGYWLKVVLFLAIYLFAVAKMVERPRRFGWILLAAALVAAVFAWLTLYYQFGVLERSLDYAVVRRERLRELGWNGFADLDHPIIAGLYYGVFAVVLTWFFVQGRMTLVRTSVLAVAVLGLLLYVLLTFSRGAWFALVGGVLVLLLLFHNRKSYSLLGIASVLLLIAVYLFWPEIQNERRVGVNGRDQIWLHWLNLLPGFWMSGAGAGAELSFTLKRGGDVTHAHSLYLQLWYEYGIVGIGLFLSLLASLLWKGWVCRADPVARLGLALLAFAMVAMVSDVYAIFHRPSPYWVVLWLPVAILLGVKAPARDQKHFARSVG